MWLATKFGFFSAVRKQDGVHIRSRSLKDLQKLVSFAEIKTPIVTNVGTDYCCRVITTHAEFVRVMTEVAEDLDYSNFKDMIASEHDQRDKLRSYHDIWDIMYQYQERNY